LAQELSSSWSTHCLLTVAKAHRADAGDNSDMELSCQDNKGNWVALYIFGFLKMVISFILVIVGIILTTHSKADCEGITQCYTEHGYQECKLGQRYDCWTRETSVDECDHNQEFLSDMSTNFGIALLIGGLFGLASGCLGGLSAHQKLQRWLGISMGLDIFLMMFAVLMFLLCSSLAGDFDKACSIMESHGSKDLVQNCWESIINDICAWSGLFGTATFCFFSAFLVELGSAITDCTACCCCPPIDAHWAVQAQVPVVAAGGGAIVVGNPIGTSSAQPGVVVANNQPKVVD